MTIKNQQYTLLVVIGVIFSLMFGIAVEANRLSGEHRANSQVMAQLIKEVFEINLVSGDYLLKHHGRPLRQMELRLASLAKLLDKPQFSEPESRDIHSGMQQELKKARQIFEKLNAAHIRIYEQYHVEVSESLDSYAHQEIEDLAMNLSINSLALVNSTNRLIKLTSEKAANDVAFYDRLMFGGLLFSFALLTLSVAKFSRRFVRSIGVLRAGAEQIESGNLQHRFSPKGTDEFSNLARAFDSMTESLQKSEILQHQMNAELEKRVIERTEHLATAVESLKRSNQELEQFAYVASHDLQEPLRMISSFSQLLAQEYRGKLDGEADEYIHYVVDGANRMQSLIQDLLSYSRVDSRGKPFEEVDLNYILGAVHSSLQLQIQETAAVIGISPLPTIISDSLQMTQLFQNLLSNSLKFRGNVLPLIQVSACDEVDFWHFTVSDNGIGIEAQYFERIFKIFQRLHTRAEYPGTGIGLAVCKRIVERHGGRIWVESEPGKGTAFHFTISKSAAQKIQPDDYR